MKEERCYLSVPICNQQKVQKGKIHPQFLFDCYYGEQAGEEKEILCKSSRVCNQ